MEETKVGALVRKNLPQLLRYCAEVDPEEVVKLSDAAYCKEELGLLYPFFRTPRDVVELDTHAHYWVQIHRVRDHDVRVTNHWFAKQRPLFIEYLLDKGLPPVGLTQAEVDADLAHVAATTPKSPGGAKFKNHAIGRAQNSAVRYVLGNLGHESFTAKDWLAVKERFHHACAYCGSRRQLVMDHAVPLSTGKLGEHRLGNLVPACHDCNTKKGQQRYDDFLRSLPEQEDAEERIRIVTDHMTAHGYRPLADVLSPEEAATVTAALEQMRVDVAQAAATAVAAINQKLSGS